MRRPNVAAFAILSLCIACDISDSIVAPKPLEQKPERSIVVPPTNNSACTVHWASGVNGSWFDASKWNPAGVPGSSSSVCIDATGTYTVTLDPSNDAVPVPVLAVSVGAVGATATLQIGGDSAKVNVTEGVAVNSGATLVFSGTGSTLTAAETLTNAGTLKVSAPCGGCGGATISADLINTGTITFTGGPTLTLSKVNGAYENTGNIQLSGFIDIPAAAGNPVFSQEGGVYSGGGNFETLQMRSGTFRLSGGKIRQRTTDNALPRVVLDGANLVLESTATDTVVIGIRGRTDVTPTITGNVPELTTLWIGGAFNGGMGNVELVGNPVNYGTIVATLRIDGPYAGTTVTGSGTLTNVGTLKNFDANRDTLHYALDITNTGTILAIGQSSISFQKSGGTYENSGLIDLEAGISRLTISSNGTFTNTPPGTITNGAVLVDGSHFRGNGSLTTTVYAQNGGSIEPGTSPGSLTMSGMRVTSTGSLNIELGGITPITEYDRVTATSLAEFSGTLNVSEINGFQAGICGQIFDVAYYPSLAAGSFPTVNGLNPAPGRMLRALYVGQTASTPAILRLVGFDPNKNVCVGPNPVAIAEGAAGVQYVVALKQAPTANVTVTPTPDAQVTVSPSSLVFTPSNWQTPQFITVTAVDDAVYEGTHAGVVTHSVTSSDPAYSAYSTASLNATITDNDVALPPVATTVSVTIDSTSLQIGNTAQASATVRDQNGNLMAAESVVWSSNTPSLASVSATGVVTALAAGTAVIKATDGSVFGTASVTVTTPPPPPPVVTTISVSIDSSSLEVGHSAQASATVRDQYGAVMTGQTITWSSDTPPLASVSNAGVVTAVSAGNATIRATIGSVFGTASLTVTPLPPPPPVVTTISVSIDSSSLEIGHTAQATATVRDQYGAVMSGQTITWSSETPLLASVNNAGVVSGLAAGNAVIRATIGSVFGTASLTVVTPPPPLVPTVKTVTVTVDSSLIVLGNSTQATATALDGTKHIISGLPVTWTSLTPSIATVSPSGIVTGIATGNAQIQATIAGVTGKVTLTVYVVSSPFKGSASLFKFGGDPYCTYIGSLNKIDISLAPRTGGYASLSAVLTEYLAAVIGGTAYRTVHGPASNVCAADKQALYHPVKDQMLAFTTVSVSVVESDTNGSVRAEFVSVPGPYPQVTATLAGEWVKVSIGGIRYRTPTIPTTITLQHVDAVPLLSWTTQAPVDLWFR